MDSDRGECGPPRGGEHLQPEPGRPLVPLWVSSPQRVCVFPKESKNMKDFSRPFKDIMGKKHGSENLNAVQVSEIPDFTSLSTPPDRKPMSLPPDIIRDVKSSDSGLRAPEPSKVEEGRLIIGAGVILKGNIECCRTLEVNGEVEAEIECDRLVINEGGTLKGSVTSKTAEISGSLSGIARIQEKVMIRSTGRFSGNLAYGGIRIEMGGLARGELEEIEHDRSPEVVMETDTSSTHPTQLQEKLLEIRQLEQPTP